VSTFLLVHGGWAGGWYWEKVVPFLEKAGRRALSPDLPGHGDDRTPLEGITLQTYVDHVLALVDDQPEPVVLVAHSSGGIVVTQAAERRPRKLAQLVYVCAYLPLNGQSLFDLGSTDSEGLIVPNLVPSPEGTSVTVRPDALQEALFADCTENDYVRAAARFTPEPLPVATTPVHLTPNGFGRVPRAYIACSRDRAMSPELQRRMSTAATCEPVIWMDTGHSPQYAAPENLAAHLVRLAGSS
jgi:pimeloyl-ACP methyl ester carboxylesterase